MIKANLNDWNAPIEEPEWVKWRAHTDEGGGGERGLALLQVEEVSHSPATDTQSTGVHMWSCTAQIVVKRIE